MRVSASSSPPVARLQLIKGAQPGRATTDRVVVPTDPRQTAVSVAALVLTLVAVGAQRPPRSRPDGLTTDAQPPSTPTAEASSQVARLREGQRLDVNRASEAELRLLPGVGPAIAQRLVRDRRKRGPYRRAGDITRVRGIGPRMLARLRPLITAELPGQPRRNGYSNQDARSPRGGSP